MTDLPGGLPSPVTLRVSEHGAPATGSFYEKVGGRPTFEKLVRAFYDGVRTDPVLLPMYPEQPELEGAIQRLTGFLEQYWGGPGTYSEQRGHPRLRMRHQPFRVNPDARDRWLAHMRAAVDGLALSPLDDATLWGYLERAAQAMVNTVDE
ncbi:MAG: globin [Lacisediminihabitans sp.]